MQNVVLQDRNTGTAFEVLAGPYLVEAEEGWINHVLGAWLDGPSAGELEEQSLDHLKIYFVAHQTGGNRSQAQ